MLNKQLIIGTAQSDDTYGFNKKKNFEGLILHIKKKKYLLDTAPNYKNSNFFFNKLGKNYSKIISKLPKISETKNFKLMLSKKINEIFYKCNSEKIYGILLHDPKVIFNRKKREILIEEINNLKKMGKIKKFGVSVYSVKETKKILSYLVPDIIQCPINIFNQTFTKDSFLQSLKKKNIEIHARSVFLQGLLLLDKKNVPNYFLKKPKVKNYFNFLEKEKLLALRFNLIYLSSLRYVDKFVVGFDNLRQLKNFLKLKKNEKFYKYKKTFFKKFEIKNIDLIDPRKWKTK